MIDVNIGLTSSFTIPGVLLFIPGIASACAGISLGLIPVIVGVVFMIVAIFLFTSKGGVELDGENGKYRTYHVIAGKKFGTWLTMKSPESAELVLHSDVADFSGMGVAVGRPGASIKALTYDLLLRYDNGKVEELYDFPSYKPAEQVLNGLHTEFGIPIRNRVAEKIAENRNRRSRR